ncbi:MAG: hypothetical protein GKS07_09180 [Nitrosopumilus sp.]|nr:MAG: hypothetical protein GKS07_09180 [Nitrosopumilus sp.]
MNSKISLFVLLAAITVTISLPVNAYATDYTNFFAAADSQENNAAQKGLKTVIEIESASGDHDFDWSMDENHNYFIEMIDDDDYIHHVGYFVDKDAQTTAKFFAEAFLGGTNKHYAESMGAVSSDGTNQYFAVHHSGSTWSYYDGTGFGDLQAQYTGGGEEFNTTTAAAVFEKGCQGGCTVDEMGDAVDVKFHTAMEHTSTITYTSANWDLVDDADMYYFADGVVDATNGAAQTAVCGEMTIEGDVQDGSLADNEMVAINETNPTCTSWTANLWS